MRTAPLVATALALAACATTPPGVPVAMTPPGPLPAEVPPFHRDGEIQFTPLGSVGNSAAWNARSVRGPTVNLTLTDQGLWGGTIRGQAVLLRAVDGRVTGDGVNLLVGKEGDVVVVEGLWLGNRTSVAAAADHVSASLFGGNCSLEIAPAPDGFWRGFAGCNGRIRYVWAQMKGVAADPTREMPQWFFAFLASLQTVDAMACKPAPSGAPAAVLYATGVPVDAPTVVWKPNGFGMVAGVAAVRGGVITDPNGWVP